MESDVGTKDLFSKKRKTVSYTVMCTSRTRLSGRILGIGGMTGLKIFERLSESSLRQPSQAISSEAMIVSFTAIVNS